jgi:hypothetical protein
MAGTTWMALSPPYRRFDLITPSSDLANRLTAGTVVHVDGVGALAVLAAVSYLLGRWPWVVPVVTLPHEEAAALPSVTSLRDMRTRLAFTAATPPRPLRPSEILTAVKHRPAVEGSALAAYVAERLDAPTLLEPLTHQFEQALVGEPASQYASGATYSRTFARYGSYTSCQWRAIARIASEVNSTARGRQDGEVVTRRRMALSHERKTTYARRYLGISWSAASKLVGWEWVLERALRRGGYLLASCSHCSQD